MGNSLRDRRTPQELAASGQVFEIAEKIRDFERLGGIVENDLEALDPDKLPPDWRNADVVGQLRFVFADAREGLPALEGEVAVTVDAVCQRCLEPFKLPLSVDVRLLFADGRADVADDGDYEVWETDEGRLRPLDLVEEMLIMAMPLAAMHDDAACAKPAEVEESAGEMVRPFASLKEQMERGE